MRAMSQLSSSNTPLPVHRAALIIGQDVNLIRQWLHRDLFGDNVQGKRQGRERLLNVAEAVILRLVAEYLPVSSSFKEAVNRAAGLGQVTVALQHEEPPMPLDVHAFLLWGGPGQEQRREAHICKGRNELALCVTRAVAKGWPHVHVFNLSDTVYEILTGWDIAVLGVDEARRRFMEDYLPRLPAERWGGAAAMFNDLERRIAGQKRPETPREESWTLWHPSEDAA